jgi:ABC-type antimicrobial peptide transport system permease subunit
LFAMAIIMVMCIIICMLLLAYNANTLSRIEVLLQRR